MGLESRKSQDGGGAGGSAGGGGCCGRWGGGGGQGGGTSRSGRGRFRDFELHRGRVGAWCGCRDGSPVVCIETCGDGRNIIMVDITQHYAIFDSFYCFIKTKICTWQ